MSFMVFFYGRFIAKWPPFCCLWKNPLLAYTPSFGHRIENIIIIQLRIKTGISFTKFRFEISDRK